MKMRFETYRYIASHGKAPKGRGQWAFEDNYGEMFFSSNMTLTAAKKEAKKYFDSLPLLYRVIQILP